MTLLRSFTTVGSFTMLSRVTGLIRDVLTATYLGAGAVADAFFIAFQLPNLFRSLFAEGAFSAGFVPIFTQILAREGQSKAKQFADDAFAVLSATLLLFSIVMIIIMPVVLYVMAPGFADIPGQMEKTTELARIAFPYLFFVSLTSLQSGVLNAFDRFAVAAAAPVLLNITLIAALLAGIGSDGDPATFLAWGVFVAGVVQFLWLAQDCKRIGMRFQMHMPRLTPDVKTLLARMAPVVFGAGIYQLNLVVNKMVATLISAGAVSWLYYADRVNLLPVGVIGVAVGVALVPLLSRNIQNGDEAAALSNQNRAIEICLLFTLPAGAGIAMLAEPITSVLFERGAFEPSDREAVAAALVAFSIGLPAYVLNKALTPGFFSRGDTRTPVKAALAAFVLNVVLNLAALKFLGHIGIALATSLSAWLNILILAMVLHRRGHLVMDKRLTWGIPKMLVASGLMCAALWYGAQMAVEVWGAVFGAPGQHSGSFLKRTLILTGLIAGGGIVYGLSILATGAARFTDLRRLRRQGN
ncbi:MAG: murein biosynthesis integral membrane protein MurJ [Rhodospirillaceae bacterium]|nr:murein biosynthesis integral membrane protein MurJ [Rhodospirillaceae bacterium]